MTGKNLTAERVRALLSYDPETGVFVKLTGRARGKPCSYTSKHLGYMLIWCDGYQYLAHRLAWLYVYGQWPEHNIDHINGIRDDNRISNLRDVPQLLNAQNRRCRGITKRKDCDRWMAQIRANGRYLCLGNFKTESEAEQAYLTAKRALHAGCTI